MKWLTLSFVGSYGLHFPFLHITGLAAGAGAAVGAGLGAGDSAGIGSIGCI